MREEARGVPTNSRASGGLVVAQWYVDAFYDDLDKLPNPSDGKATEGPFKGKTFEGACRFIEDSTEEAINAALEGVRMQLAARGVRLEVAER